MADIFGGAQLPAWLVADTHEDFGGLGKSIGTLMAGGLLALQPNDKGDGLKGLKQGLAEARMNQQDPTWKVKEKALEGQAVATWAKAATDWQKYDDTSRDMKLWMSDDLPALTKFQQDLKDNPDTVPPVMKSTRGQGAVQSIERMLLSKQSADIRQQNGKIAVENAKRSVDFDQAVSAAPPEIGSQIDELPNQGWNIDRQGRKTSPSTAALRYYNDWATQNGAEPTKAFGYKVTSVDAAEARGEEQRKTEAQKAAEKQDYEKSRQADRVAIEETKQKYKIDIEKMKLDAGATGKGGKVVNEDEYVNRLTGKVFDALYKESSNPKQALADADRVLRARWRIDHPQQPTAAKPDQFISTDEGPKDKGNAAASKPTTQSTDKDPLGILGQ